MKFNINQTSRGVYSVSSAQRVGGTRKPRTHQRFSPVKVTHADGSISVIAKPARTYNGRTRPARIIDIPKHITAADLPTLFVD